MTCHTKADNILTDGVPSIYSGIRVVHQSQIEKSPFFNKFDEDGNFIYGGECDISHIKMWWNLKYRGIFWYNNLEFFKILKLSVLREVFLR